MPQGVSISRQVRPTPQPPPERGSSIRFPSWQGLGVGQMLRGKAHSIVQGIGGSRKPRPNPLPTGAVFPLLGGARVGQLSDANVGKSRWVKAFAPSPL
ncbi:MAG: hypothetical protein RLZZ435_2593 [Cyanobacteriota bacterium]|jgi:hypothetical protein